MLILLLSAVVFVLAVLPALMTFRNLPQFRKAAEATDAEATISILIPARNEEANIESALRAVTACPSGSLEVIVLDDASSDRTAEIVAALAAEDPRIRLIASEPLPDGWNGKQFACWQLAKAAKNPLICFLDADVRLTVDAVPRLCAQAQYAKAELVSGFPHQVTESWLERLLIPMMHFVLLGYLPLERMRQSTQPEFGAGCGQLFVADRTAYFDCGGHEAIRDSRHDGLLLPRNFRRHGLGSDVFDAADIATVRMYSGASEVVSGLLKNATEGMASPRLIWIFSVLLIGGCVIPVLACGHVLYHGWFVSDSWYLRVAATLLSAAACVSFVPALLLGRRYSYSVLQIALHPLAVGLFMAIQWLAFFRERLGMQAVAWKGRTSS